MGRPTSINALITNYAIMQCLRVLDAYILNKYDMIHEDDHYLPLNGFHFIKVKATQMVAILISLTFRVPRAQSYKIGS